MARAYGFVLSASQKHTTIRKLRKIARGIRCLVWKRCPSEANAGMKNHWWAPGQTYNAYGYPKIACVGVLSVRLRAQGACRCCFRWTLRLSTLNGDAINGRSKPARCLGQQGILPADRQVGSGCWQYAIKSTGRYPSTNFCSGCPDRRRPYMPSNLL